MASPSKRQRTQAVPLPPVEEDVCVAAIHGKCDDTVVSVVPVHVVWTAETSRLVRVGGGQVSVFNLTVTDGNDMVGVTLWRGRELAGKLSKRLAYLFGTGQEADPPTFVRLVLKRFRVCPVRPASPMCMKALHSQTDSSIDVMPNESVTLHLSPAMFDAAFEALRAAAELPATVCVAGVLQNVSEVESSRSGRPMVYFDLVDPAGGVLPGLALGENAAVLREAELVYIYNAQLVAGQDGESKLAVYDEAFVQGMPSDVTATAATT